MSKVLIAAASRVELLNLNHEKPCAAAEPSSVSRKIRRRLAFSKPASKDFSAAHKKSRRPDTRLFFLYRSFKPSLASFLLIYLRYIVYNYICMPHFVCLLQKTLMLQNTKKMLGYSLIYILMLSRICVFQHIFRRKKKNCNLRERLF